MEIKPNRNSEITKTELDVLEASEFIETVDGYDSDELQLKLDF